MDEQGRKRVLIVDDDTEVLKAMMRMLEEHVTVKVALGAEAALEQMVKSKDEGILFEAVIVDFTMKGPNGAWLLRNVRDKFPDCERILVSGHSYMDLANFLTPGLLHRFLEKPLDFDKLIGAVTSDEN